MKIRPLSPAVKLTRGARADAPRRDTTMTQNSDSGDAAGDAGPTNRRREECPLAVKIDLTAGGALPLQKTQTPFFFYFFLRSVLRVRTWERNVLSAPPLLTILA